MAGDSRSSYSLVLTAAHCVDFFGVQGGLPVQALRITFDPTPDAGSTYYAVDHIVVHPDWATRPILMGNSKNLGLAPPAEDIALGLTLGGHRSYIANEEVPILSEQIAQQALLNQEEKPVKFKVWAEPAIYTPGKPVSLYWKVENLKPEDAANAEVVIHAPTGLATTDPNATYTPDGLVSIPLSSTKEFSEWRDHQYRKPA